MSQNDLPLSHIRVIDLTRVRAGPTAVRQLADWGADVIKVEAPPTDDAEGLGGPRHGPDFYNLHRNKRSITLNLKSEEGRQILLDLAKNADVVVENYRPDVKHRLGIDYEALRAVNPRIIYGSISGFGQDGPYGKRAGVDQIAQGMGGLMSITGEPGQGPMRVGIPIADLTAGMNTAMGILLALVEREKSGEGQWVHTSLLESQIAMLDFQAARWLIAKDVPGQAGNNHPTSIPTGVFATADGHINIASAGAAIWMRFLDVIGKPEWNDDARFNSGSARLENRDLLNDMIGEVVVTRSSQDWIDAFAEAGVPAGPIYSIDQVFADPQVRHVGIARPISHPTRGEVECVGQAINLSRTPQPPRMRPSPEMGEHTEEVLADLGYSADDVAQLRTRGVV
jgi:crotonobetainyl-CoA:carnitine CoA-transferase CaiB-like acyl-CoA transferase